MGITLLCKLKYVLAFPASLANADIGAHILRRADSTGESGTEMATVAFLIWATFAIFFMVQGAGLFYSGLSKRKSALTQAALSLAVAATVQVQWFIWVRIFGSSYLCY